MLSRNHRDLIVDGLYALYSPGHFFNLIFQTVIFYASQQSYFAVHHGRSDTESRQGWIVSELFINRCLNSTVVVWIGRCTPAGRVHDYRSWLRYRRRLLNNYRQLLSSGLLYDCCLRRRRLLLCRKISIGIICLLIAHPEQYENGYERDCYNYEHANDSG